MAWIVLREASLFSTVEKDGKFLGKVIGEGVLEDFQESVDDACIFVFVRNFFVPRFASRLHLLLEFSQYHGSYLLLILPIQFAIILEVLEHADTLFFFPFHFEKTYSLRQCFVK